MDVLLSLDLGTTNLKVLAVDENGQPVAGASAPTPALDTSSTHDPLAEPEYDAERLWETSAGLIHNVVSQLGPDHRVAGAAVASMAEAGVLLDAEARPLLPVVTWYDKRTVPWLDWWRERISEVELYRITGLALNFNFSANKMLWYRREFPALFERARSWLCLADWITFCLTGRLTTTFSMASRTMLFDLQARTWSEDLLRLAGLPRHLMPPAFPSGQVVGGVTPEAARLTGLVAGTPIVTGGHDHLCAALAAGVIAPGPVLDSSGTTEAILLTLDAPILDDKTAASGLCCGCHTVRGRYYLIGGMLSGVVVSWMSRLLAGDDSPATVERLMAEAATAPPGAHGVWFEPYPGGSGPPQRDPRAWGGWLGLRLGHTRADAIRATMEGLSFGFRDLLNEIQQTAGWPVRELRAVGGGTRNTWWQKLKADVLGIPIQTLAVSDVTAQGAALLAGVGLGLFDEAEAAARAFRTTTRYEVDRELHARYDTAYRQVFQKLYPALKQLPLGREGE